jgi:hypothetical protein
VWRLADPGRPYRGKKLHTSAHIRIYDVFGFFQSSFSAVVKSMVDSGRATQEEADFIATMKDRRDQFANEDIQQIKAYTMLELRALNRSDCTCGIGTARVPVGIAGARDELQRRATRWIPEDELIREAEEDGLTLPLIQAKNNKQHRTIERSQSHARKVKKVQGYVCRGCDRSMADVYGAPGLNLIHAHHLTPLSHLADGSTVRLDPKSDFAVLCPNCHAIIYRLEDVSNLAGLRKLYRSNVS